MKLVVKYLKPFGFALLIGFVIKVAGTLVELALPSILSHMLDVVVKENAPSGNLTPVFIWGGIMILCAVAALVLNIVANRMAARVAKDLKWQVSTPYGEMDMTINLSKPEKDPKALPPQKRRRPRFIRSACSATNARALREIFPARQDRTFVRSP